jgi:hypothetical protein
MRRRHLRLEASDCTHACAERAIGRLVWLANFVELLSKTRPMGVEVVHISWIRPNGDTNSSHWKVDVCLSEGML